MCFLTRLSLFFFNDTATTEIYTLPLHDALPISPRRRTRRRPPSPRVTSRSVRARVGDRKSTRLNSSHVEISYAVFCLKKKKKTSRRSTGGYRYNNVRTAYNGSDNYRKCGRCDSA